MLKILGENTLFYCHYAFCSFSYEDYKGEEILIAGCSKAKSLSLSFLHLVGIHSCGLEATKELMLKLNLGDG